MLPNIFENKAALVSASIAALIPLYAWKYLYSSYNKLKSNYEREKLFQERHNCTVMYSSNRGMTGWPPHTERLIPELRDPNMLKILIEPVSYFFATAEKSLDIALMLIIGKIFFAEILGAHRRGVKVRLILNYDHMDSTLPEIRELMKEGVKVAPYISQRASLTSIMHYKYIVKDYCEETETGYTLTGSMNLTNNAFLANYEDLTISSDFALTKLFHENFEECFDWISSENENLINKTVLLDANLDTL
ncbi:unnamed protein product [Acanthoscelides obtectus]|uniref:Mitochondrial cardiolipin hydrolase n=1 Tax=Acanthoscelides obtectus TaxID=200917 RepID=A0A9P0L2U3_ACAOB|nr:unnamed protein product [Acanthoscelides obtectus]CAK1652868.1 Mitochondrial cardiolipin hydrolase [Acanthoscelides obtectus]